MDVKKAIAAAKSYIAEVFRDEGVFNVGLEEVEYENDRWEVTVGFSRAWDKPPRSPFASISIGEAEDLRNVNRTYKVVDVDDETGKILGLRNRAAVA